MEESHKTHRPHIKVGKDEEKKKMCYFSIIIHICLILFILENDVENAPKTPESS